MNFLKRIRNLGKIESFLGNIPKALDGISEFANEPSRIDVKSGTVFAPKKGGNKTDRWFSSVTGKTYDNESEAIWDEIAFKDKYPKWNRPQENLQGQILEQWKQLGVPSIGGGIGIEQRAASLANRLLANDINDLSQLRLGTGKRKVQIPIIDEYGPQRYDEGEEDASFLQYGGRQIGFLGNADDGGRNWDPTGYLQPGNLASWTAAGSGAVGYTAKAAPNGQVYFIPSWGSTNDLGSIAPIISLASILPTPIQPFAAAANAAIAIDQGNVLGGLASLAGIPGVSSAAGAAGLGSVVSGIKTANQVNNLVNAVESGNVLGALASGANLTGTGGVQLGDTGYTVADAIKTANVINAADQGNIAPLIGALAQSGASSGPKASDFEAGYFEPGGAGYVSPTADRTPDNIDAGGGWNPALVTPQVPAIENLTVPTREEQQPSIDRLIQELAPYAPPQPSVPEENVPEMVVTAPRPEPTPEVEIPTVPTREEQQSSIDDLINILAPYAPTPDDVPEMVVTAPRPEDDPDNIDAGGGWNPALVGGPEDDVPEMVVTAPRPDTTPDNIDIGGGWNPADVPDRTPDNIDAGGGWNPADSGPGPGPAPVVPPAQPPQPARPSQPAQSSGPDLLSLLGLMGLLGAGQQQSQQPVQTPLAEVKSFEEQGYGDIFGTDLQFSEGGEVDELLQILRG